MRDRRQVWLFIFSISNPNLAKDTIIRSEELGAADRALERWWHLGQRVGRDVNINALHFGLGLIAFRRGWRRCRARGTGGDGFHAARLRSPRRRHPRRRHPRRVLAKRKQRTMLEVDISRRANKNQCTRRAQRRDAHHPLPSNPHQHHHPHRNSRFSHNRRYRRGSRRRCYSR